MSTLTIRTKLFIGGESCAALFVVAVALAHWSWSGAVLFLVLLGMSGATGAMKVVLPRVQGSLSVAYVFVMFGIANFSLGETLLMGWAATLVQSYWHCKKRPPSVQLLFNLAVVSVSIGFGSLAFKPGLIPNWLPNRILPIFLAAFAYFIANTLSVSTVIGLTERLSVWHVWRTSYFWSFPHYVLSASLVGAVEYLRATLGLQAALLILPPAFLVYQTFVMHIGRLNQALERAEQEKRHAEETANRHLRTIHALALAIEAKDQTTGAHLHRVQTYAMELAKDLSLPPEETEALRAAAILHDVGKLAVPEHIISKPGKLTPSEFAKMKIHTVVGAEIVATVNFPFAVAPLVRAHHEKWDGSGYPDGLRGEVIPLGARILTVVDCLDALASDRQYRKAMPLEKAMAIIVAESGRSFDPRVVEALRERYAELESLAQSTWRQDLIKLSIDAKVDRGFGPDAGYAAGSLIESNCPRTSEEVAREISALNSIRSQIGRFESIGSDLSALEERLRELIPFDCIALYGRRGEMLECIFAKGEEAALFRGLSVESGVGVSGWTMANRTPLLNGNAATEFGVAGKAQSKFSLSSALSMQLESEFGPIGVLTVYSRQPDAFRTDHLRVLLAISSTLAYQMSLDSSRPANGTRPAQAVPGAPVGEQLRQLSQAMQADSVPSTPLVPQRV